MPGIFINSGELAKTGFLADDPLRIAQPHSKHCKRLKQDGTFPRVKPSGKTLRGGPDNLDTAWSRRPFKTAFVAAQHGILGLTKTMALETAEHRITVNAICSGYVLTPVRSLLEREASSATAIPRPVSLLARKCRQCSSQHFEVTAVDHPNDRRRSSPSWVQAMPALQWKYIAISKRCIVHEGKINQIAP